MEAELAAAHQVRVVGVEQRQLRECADRPLKVHLFPAAAPRVATGWPSNAPEVLGGVGSRRRRRAGVVVAVVVLLLLLLLPEEPLAGAAGFADLEHARDLRKKKKKKRRGRCFRLDGWASGEFASALLRTGRLEGTGGRAP